MGRGLRGVRVGEASSPGPIDHMGTADFWDFADQDPDADESRFITGEIVNIDGGYPRKL